MKSLKTSGIQPVIMNKYYRYRDGRRMATGMRFIPGVANYNTLLDETPVYSNLDTLIVPSSSGKGTFLEVHLTAEARVILLLTGGRDIRTSSLRDNPPKVVTGLPGKWTDVTAVRAGEHSEPAPGVTEMSRLPKIAVAVQQIVPAGTILRLPGADSISIDGRKPRRYSLLFAQPGSGTPVAPAYPGMPSADAIRALAPDADPLEIPRPNTRCPDWLHDIHIVRTQDEATSTSLGEPKYWRTWHPVIDSIYWCYYGHSHGSFPGHFRPPLGYTAFKTPDEKTDSGRQDESHRGFKIFAFALPGDKTVVIATIHALLSDARRFTTRFHTTMIAVFNVDGQKWTKTLELRMKMDFGAAQFQKEKSGLTALTKEDEKIEEELDNENKRAGRRFNVINDALTTGDDGVRDFVYEQWMGPLNTCSGRADGKRVDRGFKFDFRDPATGLHDLSGKTTQENMPFFERKNSMNLLLVISKSGVRIAPELCQFDESQAPFTPMSGVFYTDPYFKEMLPGPASFAVRQFMDKGFANLVIPEGKITATDEWSGHMSYSKGDAERRMRFENVEGAVNKTLN